MAKTHHSRPAACHLREDVFSRVILLVDRTGDAPFFSCLEYSHAFVDVFHLLGRVGYASGTFSTPYTEEEDDPGCERRELRRYQEGLAAIWNIT
jgi:hypothetical protein